jgi:hypothetical protein
MGTGCLYIWAFMGTACLYIWAFMGTGCLYIWAFMASYRVNLMYHKILIRKFMTTMHFTD